MAEYYPLLVRAVAGLADSTPDTRRAIYERARSALLGQLRAVQPPVPEADIQRESLSLDEAIARIEDEIAARKSAGDPPAVPAPPPSSSPPAPPPPRSPVVRPPEPLVRRPDAGGPRPASSPRPGLPPRPALPPRPGAGTFDRPTANGADAARPRTPPVTRAAPPHENAAPASVQSVETLPPDAPRPVPEAPRPVPEAQRPVPEAPRPVPETSRSGPETPRPGFEPVSEGGSEAPPLMAGSRDDEANGGRAPDMRAERPERRSAEPRPVNVTLRKFGPRAEAAGVADQPLAPAGAEPAEEAPLSRGVVRPAAPQRHEEKPRNLRPWLIGVPLALIVGGIAVFAYIRRDDPEELARMKPAATEAASDAGNGKIAERIGGGQAPRAAEPARPATPAGDQTSASGTSAPAAPSTPPGSASQSIPIAQRAALLVDAPNDPQKVKTFVGNVVWRLENVSRGPGQPLSIGVRAEVDLPDAQMKAVMLIQKNTDETLPASHTIEVRFTPADGSPIPGVSQISTPQMRKEDTPAGDALTGVPTPIMQNFFLVGLSRGDTAVTRNIDLMKSRAWFDIPMLLSDQRIAKITFEKGSSGERVLNEALEAWSR